MPVFALLLLTLPACDKATASYCPRGVTCDVQRLVSHSAQQTRHRRQPASHDVEAGTQDHANEVVFLRGRAGLSTNAQHVIGFSDNSTPSCRIQSRIQAQWDQQQRLPPNSKCAELREFQRLGHSFTNMKLKIRRSGPKANSPAVYVFAQALSACRDEMENRPTSKPASASHTWVRGNTPHLPHPGRTLFFGSNRTDTRKHLPPSTGGLQG